MTRRTLPPSKGWRHTFNPSDPTDDHHVIPVDDLIDHNETNCVCDPRIMVEVVEGQPDAYIMIHHSLDNREAYEDGR